MAGALSELGAATGSGRIDDCHLLAHDLGHAAFERWADLGRALKAGSDACSHGYVPGVVESAVRRAPLDDAGRVDISALCGPVARDRMLHDSCTHGLGHGLMHRLSHDVRRSLEACTVLRSPDRPRCLDGVLMEASMQHLGLDPESYRRVAPNACRGLGLPAHLSAICHSEIGEVAMLYFGHRLAEAEDLCRSLEAPSARESCISGARRQGSLAGHH